MRDEAIVYAMYAVVSEVSDSLSVPENKQQEITMKRQRHCIVSVVESVDVGHGGGRHRLFVRSSKRHRQPIASFENQS